MLNWKAGLLCFATICAITLGCLLTTRDVKPVPTKPAATKPIGALAASVGCQCGAQCNCQNCNCCCGDKIEWMDESEFYFIMQAPRDQGPIKDNGVDQGPLGRWQPRNDPGLFGLEELAKAVREVKDLIWGPNGTADQLNKKYDSATSGATILVVVNLVCNVLQSIALLAIMIVLIAIYAKMPNGSVAGSPRRYNF